MTSSSNTPTREQILSQRDRVLASSLFVSSQRLSDFLVYLVDQALGDRPRLKELAIAMAVFDRDESFDPRVDSIVRVEAGRLRAKLLEYYQDEGSDDPVRIIVPKGTYLPRFERVQSPPDAKRPPRIRAWMAAVGALLVVATAAVFLGRPDPARPVEDSAQRLKIAVLPLRDWSQTAPPYFSEAMTDALIARLSENPALRVTSLASVLPYAEETPPLAEIGERLDVDYLVQGTLLREGDRVRISAQLSNAFDGGNLWSGTWEHGMESVLALQKEVAADISLRLVGALLTPIDRPGDAVNPAAYEAYLKGRYWRNRLTADGFNRGIRFFQEAIEQQPDYAEAYAGLAACHCQLGGHGFEVIAPKLALPEARRLADHALEIDPNLAEPQAVLGIIAFKYDWDAEAAERHLLGAIERNPSLFEAHLWYSQVLEGLGRHDAAVQWARRAQALNPLSVAANMNLGWQLLQSRDQAAAETVFRELIDFDPEFWGGHWGLAYAFLHEGAYSEAAAEFLTAHRLHGGHAMPLAGLGYTLAVAGDPLQAQQALEQLEAMGRDSYVSPINYALVYAGLGDADSAIHHLEEAVRVRARAVAWLAVTREFDALRTDPRFQAIERTIGIGG